MFIGTHMGLPLLMATAGNLAVTARRRHRLFAGRDLFFIALCGGLPDFLSPHIRLAARMSSPTHTLWFAMAAVPVIALWCFLAHRQRAFRVGILCETAICLHLLCDAVAGGIAPFYPFDSSRWGAYYVPPDRWLFLDAVFISLCLAGMAGVRYLERGKRTPWQRGVGKTATS
ncbi:hypothetical protein DENIS_3952 [Desulfonema ishimotonii]|uniref:Metal-dependent hydrolase n=1 Tax=Desulfonema ishimotonii TaxID=45657 RepID=A0A401G182_9BACT|nr:metal-dependent hydrolase [Desulfonema ishimotonii]GBC62966.1 hypothetical protein DENIS_3952 [Desulfonema ishimotonii]